MRDAKQDIDLDIAIFLDKHLEMSNEDKKKLLRAMFEKHILLNQSELILTKHDFDMIKSTASQLFLQANLPIKVSKKQIDSSEVSSFLVVEAVIRVLNNKNALKRSVKFEE